MSHLASRFDFALAVKMQVCAWIGKDFRPVVDRIFDLSDIAQAQAYVETKRARGKVVLRVATP